MRGKVGVTYRHYFVVRDPADGSPATGIASVDFTVTVRNPQNSASNAPSVTEVSGGLYYFDIPGSFTTTHGDGEYGIVIAVDSAAPAVVDTGGGVIEIESGYTVKQSYSYNSGTTTLAGLISVEQDGVVVTPTSVSVEFFNSSGTSMFTITDGTPDAQGVLSVSKASPGFASGNGYYAVATVVVGAVTIEAWKGLGVVGA